MLGSPFWLSNVKDTDPTHFFLSPRPVIVCMVEGGMFSRRTSGYV